MDKYQLNYASSRLQMYDVKSRKQKARRIIKTLKYKLGNIRKLDILDIGASTGIIAYELAKEVKSVVGIDIDKEGIAYANQNYKRKNLKFKLDDAMKLSFKKNCFDVVICAHIYEHVPSPQKLFKEIYKVLKPGGICYLAAVNKLWPIEPHYNLLCLSWLPKTLANWYIRISGKALDYYEDPKTYWGLRKLTQQFIRLEYTQKILQNPQKFGYGDLIKPPGSYLLYLLAPLSKYLSPTFFWFLVKEK